MSQQSSEGPRQGASFLEHLLKLNYHSAQRSDTVSSAMCTKADELQGAKGLDLVAQTISDKSKHASAQGKKLLRPIVSISAVEKSRWKTQSNVEIWNGPEKEAVKKKKDYSSKTLPLGKMDGVVKLSQQRILSAKSESEKGLINANYQHPLVESLSPNNPWKSVSELISEKWLFHSPDYSPVSHKCFLQRRSQFEIKLMEDFK